MSLSVPVSELPVVSVYVCVGVCIAGLWQRMMLSLVVSEHLCGAAVCMGVIVCPSASVSLAIHHDPSAWLGSAGAAGGDPQSAVVLYLLLLSRMLLARSLARGAAGLVLRRPGSVDCLPHSLCPCPTVPEPNRKSAAGFHGDGAGLVGWTGRQGRDRGKHRFLRESLPSALHMWPPTPPHTFLGTEAREAADCPPNMGAPDHRDRDRR